MATLPIHVDLSNTIGALEIGSILAVFLFGILTLQTYFYYTTFPRDSWSNKTLVALIWLLELGHTTCVSFEVYRVTIMLYGQPQLLAKYPGLEIVTIFGGLITWLIQGFFARRIYHLFQGPYNLIGAFCLVAATIRVIGSAYLTSKAINSSNITQYSHDFKWLISALLASGAAIDVIIAVSLLSFFVKKRDKGFSRLSKFIDKLIAYTIRTGLLTSISAVLMLVTFQTISNTLIWLAVYTFLAKLYSNSLLSALNARHDMAEDMRSPTVDYPETPLSPISNRRNTDIFVSSQFVVPSAISIEMITAKDYPSDNDVLPDKSVNLY